MNKKRTIIIVSILLLLSFVGLSIQDNIRTQQYKFCDSQVLQTNNLDKESHCYPKENFLYELNVAGYKE